MSAYLGKAGKRLFEKHLEQYAPQDPLYEHYTDSKGKQKRRKRALPPGLSKRDAKILKSVQRRAHYLDKGFNICGLRFGWTFIIGLFPVVGDVTDLGLNYILVVRKAQQADLPDWLITRLHANNAVSFACGFVPLAGDLVLAMYKANSRNAALLEEFLRIRGEEFLKMSAERDRVPRIGRGNKPDVSMEDAAQLKPGAGMTAGELPAAAPSAAAKASPASANTQKSTGSRKSFSFFNKKSPATALTSGDRSSRFVEDMGNDGTVKKRK